MRIKAKVTDLSLEQWDHLQESVRANGYEFTEGQTRVCAVFELGPQTERHVEMPLMMFTALIQRLAHRGHRDAVAVQAEIGTVNGIRPHLPLAISQVEAQNLPGCAPLAPFPDDLR